MIRVLTAALALVLAASSVWADVIPTQYKDTDASPARTAVASRLQDLGFTADRAAVQAKGLSGSDARFFAADLNRIQVAGYEDEDGVGKGERYFWGATALTASLGVIAAVILAH